MNAPAGKYPMPAHLPPNSVHALVAMITQLRIDLEKLRIQVAVLMRQKLASQPDDQV